jgi:DDE domain
MAPLPVMGLIEKVVRCPEPETVRAAGPAERDLTLTDQAKFVICHHTIEQDHRTVKRITRPMLGFKSVEAAQYTLAGVELMHMLKKGQLVVEEGEKGLTPAEQFDSLAA